MDRKTTQVEKGLVAKRQNDGMENSIVAHENRDIEKYQRGGQQKLTKDSF